MVGKTNLITKILIVTLVACVGFMGNSLVKPNTRFSRKHPLNVILVVTDDQRYDTLWVGKRKKELWHAV